MPGAAACVPAWPRACRTLRAGGQGTGGRRCAQRRRGRFRAGRTCRCRRSGRPWSGRAGPTPPSGRSRRPGRGWRRGATGLPVGVVNTYPVWVHRVPAAFRSACCCALCSRSAAIVVLSSAITRHPAPLFGGPATSRPPSCCNCPDTARVPASRSRSLHRSPAASPRRSPRKRPGGTARTPGAHAPGAGTAPSFWLSTPRPQAASPRSASHLGRLLSPGGFVAARNRPACWCRIALSR
jgi:hypothetical protein